MGVRPARRRALVEPSGGSVPNPLAPERTPTDDRYAHAVPEIERRSALRAGYVADPYQSPFRLERNLGRTRRLLTDLGDPQNDLRIVHVAGSKGKATTSTHIANILTESGFRTGLFTSPHLHSWRERIAVDGLSISQEDFGLLAGEVLSAAEIIETAESLSGPVNASEVLLGIAALYFRQRQCDFAVIEVGLGGRYDATNVVGPEVAVITELELEHVAILGPSIADIAWNKGGIIKQQVPVVSLLPPPEAESVLRMIAHSSSAPMLMENREWSWFAGDSGLDVQLPHRLIRRIVPPAPGGHQRQNAALAAAAVSQLRGSGLPPGDDAIRAGICRTQLPGHFEVVETKQGRIVLDVAHTPRSIELLLDALAETGIERPRVIVAGFLADKDIQAIVSLLAPIASEVILLPVQSPRSASIEQLNETALHHPHHVRTDSRPSGDLLTASSQPVASEWTVVTGSSALVAEVRRWLGLSETGL